MAMTRVWNITDDDSSKVKPQNLMVLGRLVKPGRFIRVEEADLKNAHKTHLDVERKLIYIGMTPPGAYVAAKTPARATLPTGMARSHGPVPEVEEEVELEDAVAVEDSVAIEVTEPETEEAEPEDA